MKLPPSRTILKMILSFIKKKTIGITDCSYIASSSHINHNFPSTQIIIPG